MGFGRASPGPRRLALADITSRRAAFWGWGCVAVGRCSLTLPGAARRVGGVRNQERSPAMFGLGYQELLLILVIVLILFGAQRLPDLARSLGSSVKEFKKGVADLKDEASTTEK